MASALPSLTSLPISCWPRSRSTAPASSLLASLLAASRASPRWMSQSSRRTAVLVSDWDTTPLITKSSSWPSVLPDAVQKGLSLGPPARLHAGVEQVEADRKGVALGLVVRDDQVEDLLDVAGVAQVSRDHQKGVGLVARPFEHEPVQLHGPLDV